MMFNMGKHFWTPLSVVALGTALQAGIVAHRSLIDLVDASDVILTGEVASIESARDSGTLMLLANEVLKGSITAGPVRVAFRGILPSPEKRLKGKRVLIFAKAASADDSALELIPIVDGAGTYLEQTVLSADSVASRPILEKASQDTPLQKVIKEVATLQANSDSATALAYLMPLAWSRVEAGTTREVFRAIRQSGSQAGVTRGTIGLVALGDLEGVQAVDSSVAQGKSDVDGAIESIERTFRDTSPQALEIFARWLRPVSPLKLRVAAAGALARIHTPGAVVLLGPALFDAEFQVRWRAIGGLSMFANNVPIGGAGPAPGDWPFRTELTARFSVFDQPMVRKNESYYLEFWRTWWGENQTSIAKLPRETTP